MDILTALKVSVSGFLVVFSVLGLICLCIIILSKIIGIFNKPKAQGVETDALNTPIASEEILVEATAIGYGELKLYGVDEKTAAMIMAIVSDESQIPLSQLRFKSIKLLNESWRSKK